MTPAAFGSSRTLCVHWLTDRWFLGALVLQLANDQILKPWLGPGPLGPATGKISDFTAPLVGSVIIAVILALTSTVLPRVWVSVRVRHLIALSVPALVLIGINLSHSAARWYEHILAGATGTSHQVIVDPTDQVGLLILPLVWRVLTRPDPLTLTISRTRLRPMITTLLGGLAMLVTVANSVAEYQPRSELTEHNGVLYAHSPEGTDIRATIDEGQTWDWYWNLDVIPPDDLLFGELDAVDKRILEHCLDQQTSTCVRIAGPVTVEESNDGGETWQVAWHLDDNLAENLRSDSHGYQEYGGDISLTDIHETNTGAILIAAGNLDPVRRSPTGQWTPTITDLRSIPVFWLILMAVVVAVLAVLISLIKVKPLWGGLLVAGGLGTAIGLPLLLSFIGSSSTLSTVFEPIAGVVGMTSGLWLPIALVLVLTSGSAGRRILGRNLLIGVAAVVLGFGIWWLWAATGFGSHAAAWTVVGILFFVAVVVMLLPERFFPARVNQ